MNKTLYIAAGIALGVSLNACDDLMEPAIDNLNEFSSLYGSVNQAAHVLGNAYMKLPYPSMPETDLATDDAVTNDADNSFRLMAGGSWTATSNPVDRWKDSYYAIQNINIFLENIDEVNWSEDPVYAEMIRDHMRGEALALRGLFHYFLLQAHAGKVGGTLMGVPIHIASETGASNFNVPRNTFQECYDQIMKDLDDAAALLPEVYVNVKEEDVPAKYKEKGGTAYDYNRAQGELWSGKVDGRIIKTFKSLLSLMAASPAYGAETWENAAKYASDVITSLGGISALTGNSIAWFNDKEYIENGVSALVVPDVAIWWNGRNKTADYEGDNFPPSLYGKGRVNPTQNLVDAFPMENGYPITEAASGYNAQDPYTGRDPRLAKYILFDQGVIENANNDVITTGDYADNKDGRDKDLSISTRTGYYMKKLLRTDANPSSSSKSEQYHLIPRIRVVEMFLTYAEAANEAWGPTTGSPSAYDVIKQIRQYAGITGGDAYLESIKGDKDKMREMIRNERRINLCFENKRFWDLRRWNVSLSEPAKGVKITKDGNTRKFEYIEVEKRDFKDYQVYCPIPAAEINKFPALQQNDGWQ